MFFRGNIYTILYTFTSGTNYSLRDFQKYASVLGYQAIRGLGADSYDFNGEFEKAYYGICIK